MYENMGGESGTGGELSKDGNASRAAPTLGRSMVWEAATVGDGTGKNSSTRAKAETNGLAWKERPWLERWKTM
jgi:hypothetical protein